MAIDPEVIPLTSNEGDSAIEIIPSWSYIILLITLIALLVVVIKLFAQLTLVSLGFLFLWRLATKRIQN